MCNKHWSITMICFSLTERKIPGIYRRKDSYTFLLLLLIKKWKIQCKLSRNISSEMRYRHTHFVNYKGYNLWNIPLGKYMMKFNPLSLTTNVHHYIETSQLICIAFASFNTPLINVKADTPRLTLSLCISSVVLLSFIIIIISLSFFFHWPYLYTKYFEANRLVTEVSKLGNLVRHFTRNLNVFLVISMWIFVLFSSNSSIS